MSLVKANTFQDASGGSNAVFSGVASPPNSMGFRNRIINGDMRIDQRNAGASKTVSNSTDTYYLDRWAAFTATNSNNSIQQVSTAPTGFTNSLQITVGTGASPAAGAANYLYQIIEGFNAADLGFGAAGAATVTVSFWVRSSLTGTFSGALSNNAVNRSYPFTYSISAANTWEQKTVTIAGDTSGTWLTNNGVGIRVWFDLGSGSNFQGTAGAWAGADRRAASGSVQLVATTGATFYITGVQLEAGTVASPFERVEYGAMLRACQRYFLKTFDQSVAIAQNAGRNGSLRAYAWTTSASTVPIGITWQYPVEMRAAPTITTYNPNNTNSSWRNNGNTGDAGAATTEIGTRNALLYINATLGATDSFIIHASATAEL